MEVQAATRPRPQILNAQGGRSSSRRSTSAIPGSLAPFDGIVTNHHVDVGALVGVSGPTTLATIVQTDPIYVYFTLSEPQVLAIQQKQRQGAALVSSRT